MNPAASGKLKGEIELKGTKPMNYPLSRRTWVRCVSFGVALLVVLCAFILRLWSENISYRRAASVSSARAFQELTESIDKVDTDLRKCTYSTSPGMISALCTQIYGETAAAAQAISELPYANIQLENTTKFVNRAGSYAQSLAKSVAASGGYSEEELNNIKALSKAASTLSTMLDELANQLNDGTLNLEDAGAVEERLATLTEDQELFTGSSYESIEADFPELPTLIYDGPFSEHLQSRSAAVLEDEAEITRAQAQEYAAQFLNVKSTTLVHCNDVEGEMPCFVFQEGDDGTGRTISVTKKGGYILSISDPYQPGAKQLTHEQAVQKARDYLKAHDITDMKESYFIERDNCLTINFAAMQEDVVCYPDLIKVEVALDTGAVVGFESAGYLMNHTTRNNLTPSVTQSEAEQAVSTELTQESCRLTLIPTSGEYEKLCWEFKCKTADGQHCLVYVGAQSGVEEQILLLLEDESGTLTV